MEGCTQCHRLAEELEKTWKLMDRWKIEEQSAFVKSRLMGGCSRRASECPGFLVGKVQEISCFPDSGGGSGALSMIAYHHNKQMVMEIESSSFIETGAYLSKLDFALIESDKLSSDNWDLIGGRYCALNGRLAAQLRIRNRKNRNVYTFYQLTAPSNISRREKDYESFEKGIKVKLWQEKGLLSGIAGPE